MAITYTWDVKTCDTYPSYTDSQDPANTESDVVYNVHWRLTAEDDANQDAEGNNITATVYGSQGLDVSDLGTFTAWADLTSSDVQGWVETAIGADEVTALKAGLDAQIIEIVTPTSVTKIIGG